MLSFVSPAELTTYYLLFQSLVTQSWRRQHQAPITPVHTTSSVELFSYFVSLVCLSVGSLVSAYPPTLGLDFLVFEVRNDACGVFSALGSSYVTLHQ